jgi:hypothetical protein
MSNSESQLYRQHDDEDDDYEEFARRMQLFEDGPITTTLDQLLEDGVELPEPGSIRDADVSATLWRVIHAMARRRVYIDQTDHLSDRELYSSLWHDILREEVPAIDEIGFNTEVQLSGDGEPGTYLYFRHYAAERDRQIWLRDFPDYEMPAHEDPPYSRDWLLPSPYSAPPAEAREWLRNNRNPSAFATNRFATTADASRFVEQLYAAGASRVMVDNTTVLRPQEQGLYGDTLVVVIAADVAQRSEIRQLVEEVGRPDHTEQSFVDSGQESLWLWWD